MFGTTFCQMENSLLMTLTMLLLLGVREGTSENKTTNFITPNSSIPQNFTITNATVQQKPCPIHNITQHVMARLKVIWNKGSLCEGKVYLHSPDQHLALCYSSYIPESWWSELCKDVRCGEYKGFKVTSMADGYLLTSNKTLTKIKCRGLHIICEDSLGSELAAYKAVTGILIFLMLGVILLQFSRPAYKAIRKRFSQKRQNRWIGPTQSQSVSYHRGQGAPNNNTLKRQSFPGLERLTVNTSREPSSNRNSDYDSYGYN